MFFYVNVALACSSCLRDWPPSSSGLDDAEVVHVRTFASSMETRSWSNSFSESAYQIRASRKLAARTLVLWWALFTCRSQRSLRSMPEIGAASGMLIVAASFTSSRPYSESSLLGRPVCTHV